MAGVADMHVAEGEDGGVEGGEDGGGRAEARLLKKSGTEEQRGCESCFIHRIWRKRSLAGWILAIRK